MAAIEFVWDSRDLEVWRSAKVERALTRALRLAGNQAARVMQKKSLKQVQSRKFIRETRILKGLPLSMPSRSAEIQRLVWTERVSGRPIPLVDYPHSRSKSGIMVSVNRTGGVRKLVKAAFAAQMKSGHKGIYRRQGRGRLPIRELFSSTIANALQDSSVLSSILNAASQRFDRAFARGLPRELAKVK
jgi:hypothetical protein